MLISRSLGVAAGIASLAAQTPPPSFAHEVRVPTRVITKAERPPNKDVGVETFRSVVVPLIAEARRDGDPPALAQAVAGGFPTRGKLVRLAIAWTEGERLARYGVDADGDGRIAPDEVREVAAQISAATGTGRPRVQFAVPLRQNVLGRAFGIQIRRLEDGVIRAEVSGDIEFREGTTELDGVPHTCLVLDGDDDGVFGSDGDHFAFLPSADYARVRRFGAGRGVSFRATDTGFLGERRLRLVRVDDDGVAVLRFVEAEEPLSAYLAKRQARAVEGHRASLAAQEADLAAREGFDLATPKAETPVPWSWVVDADAALAIARAANKPLLLVYGEETDERCAMMDVYTWSAAEVVAALRPFVCARVSIDLDVAQTWSRYQVRFGPAYVFVAPDGRHLRFSDRRSSQPSGNARGFKAPTAMVEFLRAQAARLEAAAFDPPDKR